VVRGRCNNTPTPQAGRMTDSAGGGRVRVGDEGGGRAEVLPHPHSTWRWRGQTSILGFEMERERGTFP
jgi:hypothetical protein